MKNTEIKYNRSQTAVNIFLCLMLLGLPLVYDNKFYNITEAKSGYFYFLSLIFLFAVVLLSVVSYLVKKPPLRIKTMVNGLTFTDVSLLCFGLFVLISAVLSSYQSDVWLGANSRYQGAVTVILYIAVYFAVSRNFRFSQSLILCCVFASLIVSVLGVLNCFDIDILGMLTDVPLQYKKDFLSTIGNKNFYSSYFCLILPLVLCGFCSTRETVSRIIYTLSLVINSFGMSVTGSESFVIGFVFSVLVFPLFLLKDAEKLRKFLIGIIVMLLSAQVFRLIYHLAPVKLISYSELLLFLLHPVITAVIILICSAVGFFLYKRPEELTKVRILYIFAFTVILTGIFVLFLVANLSSLGELNKYFRIDDYWGTNRGGIWRKCIERFSAFSLKEKLFGIGPEALYHIIDGAGAIQGQTVDQAHNEYLQYLLTTGIAGLLAYLSVLVSVIVTAVRRLKDNTFAVALLSGLIAFWFQASVNIAQPFTTPLMFIFISVISGLEQNKTKAITSE